jgi:hypothetical protein
VPAEVNVYEGEVVVLVPEAAKVLICTEARSVKPPPPFPVADTWKKL